MILPLCEWRLFGLWGEGGCCYAFFTPKTKKNTSGGMIGASAALTDANGGPIHVVGPIIHPAPNQTNQQVEEEEVVGHIDGDSPAGGGEGGGGWMQNRAGRFSLGMFDD